MPPAAGTTTALGRELPRPGTAVRLDAPRPDGERRANEYVETPLRPSSERQPLAGHPKPSNHQRCVRESRSPEAEAEALTGGRVGAHAPVTKQPISFTKQPGRAEAPAPPGPSILCERCGRCRCEGCREPPPLPSRWLCDNACFCSAETALDYVSCLCCVKGLFYHCADGAAAADSGADGGAPGGCADEPCACGGARSGLRWAVLGALAPLLPCLLCYWPLRACVTACEACYARHAAQGCRCAPARPPGETRDPEKRLLEPVDT